MTIHVTEEHIRKGRKHVCTTCPVALAMCDAGLANAYASLGEMAWDGLSEALQIRPPPKVSAFIRAFDAGRPVKPFSFRLP